LIRTEYTKENNRN